MAKPASASDIKQLERIERIDDFLTDNDLISATMPDYVANKAALVNSKDTCRDRLSKLQMSTEGTTSNKGSARDLMEKLAAKIASKVLPYSKKNHNTDLTDFLKTCTFSQLHGGSGPTSKARCQQLHNLVNAEIASLAPYKVTAGNLISLQTYINNFTDLQEKPRESAVTLKRYRTEFKQALEEGNLARIAIMDNANTLVDDEPEFVSDLKNNNKLMAVGYTKLSAKGKVSSTPPENTPLANVNVSIHNQDNSFQKTVTSTLFGNYQVSALAAGQYYFDFSLAGYTSFTAIVNIVANQTTTLNVTLNSIVS